MSVSDIPYPCWIFILLTNYQDRTDPPEGNASQLEAQSSKGAVGDITVGLPTNVFGVYEGMRVPNIHGAKNRDPLRDG